MDYLVDLIHRDEDIHAASIPSTRPKRRRDRPGLYPRRRRPPATRDLAPSGAAARQETSQRPPVTGTITETLTANHHKRIKTFKLATLHASLNAGVAKTVAVNVPAALVLALRHHIKESAAFSLGGANANGVAQASAKLLCRSCSAASVT
jgi:hypothetical protein